MDGLASAQQAYEQAGYGPGVDEEDAYDSYLATFHRLQDAAWDAYQRDVEAGAADPASYAEWLAGEDDRPDSFDDFAFRFNEERQEAWADDRADERREELLFGG